jgi:hypothetical protein
VQKESCFTEHQHGDSQAHRDAPNLSPRGLQGPHKYATGAEPLRERSTNAQVHAFVADRHASHGEYPYTGSNHNGHAHINRRPTSASLPQRGVRAQEDDEVAGVVEAGAVLAGTLRERARPVSANASTRDPYTRGRGGRDGTWYAADGAWRGVHGTYRGDDDNDDDDVDVDVDDDDDDDIDDKDDDAHDGDIAHRGSEDEYDTDNATCTRRERTGSRHDYSHKEGGVYAPLTGRAHVANDDDGCEDGEEERQQQRGVGMSQGTSFSSVNVLNEWRKKRALKASSTSTRNTTGHHNRDGYATASGVSVSSSGAWGGSEASNNSSDVDSSDIVSVGSFCARADSLRKGPGHAFGEEDADACSSGTADMLALRKRRAPSKRGSVALLPGQNQVETASCDDSDGCRGGDVPRRAEATGGRDLDAHLAEAEDILERWQIACLSWLAPALACLAGFPCMQACTQSHTRTYSAHQSQAVPRVYAHMHACARTYMHTYIHTHVHA